MTKTHARMLIRTLSLRDTSTDTPINFRITDGPFGIGTGRSSRRTDLSGGLLGNPRIGRLHSVGAAVGFLDLHDLAL